MPDLMSRVASAPISWGICEVPGWGAMLPTDRVLGEMASLGLPATELGAPGFLATSPEAVKAELAEFDMALIGGFTPIVLHDRRSRAATIATATATATLFERAGATEFIPAVVMDEGWSVPRELDADEMNHLIEMLGIIDEICAEHGLQQVLHPHVQTLVESASDVQRVLDHCGVKWCLDTGHLAIGGVDPVAFACESADRVGHVHLKDVNMSMAAPILSHEMPIMAGVRQTNDEAGPITSMAQSLAYPRDVVAPRVDRK
ncbi:MAG: inosose dehydratase [Candidatus Nanopelagicales bacterium]|nr:inosose dehydratase [Candidatus Nanopelagicales bacterium]